MCTAISNRKDEIAGTCRRLGVFGTAASACPDGEGPLLPMLALQTDMHHYDGSGPLAQPDRAADFESAGSGFESSRGRQYGTGRLRVSPDGSLCRIRLMARCCRQLTLRPDGLPYRPIKESE